ncbi:2S seed storage protein-like [Bidens hawaiensis]|uniref:2S seed storage protein-like n=1 Tax=Bidens hawaiensis TaxID=980011 RepID=UPI00404A1C12
MAKLIALALAFVALVTAHATIVTTAINDEFDFPFGEQMQCRRQLQGQNLNPCRTFLQKGRIPFQGYFPMKGFQEPFIQQCCQVLQNINEPCQCEAVKQVFQEAQQQQQQEWHSFIPFLGSQQSQQLRQKAQAIPNLCNLQTQCGIGSNPIDFPFQIPFFPKATPPFGGSQPQCSETDIQRPVNKCQRFVTQQLQYPEMSVGYQQEQSPELQQCCDELQYMKNGCECRAIREIASRVMKQQSQFGRFGRQQSEMVRQIVQDLPNQCNLDMSQQCTF